jgi:hypothetical protein
MSTFLLGVMLVLGVVGLVLVVDIARSLRDLRSAVFRLEWSRPIPISSRLDRSWERGGIPMGCAEWVFTNGTWKLETNACPPNYEPGPPPTIRGRFEGDRILQECIPRRQG